VERIEQLIRGGGGEAAWIARQQQRLDALRQRIPSSAQVPQLLDALLEQVSGAALHLTDVNQGNLEPAKDAEGSPVVLDGLPCLRLPISLTAEGRFHAVVAFLERLAGAGFPGLATVERARLAIKDPLNAQLNATVQLALYVIEQ
jgi:Tfp pilus assembly protein PilO